MKSIKQFITENRVRLAEVEMVGENPNNPDWKEAYHYRCVLKVARRQMTVHFSMGYGHSREPDAQDLLDCLASDASTVASSSSFEDWARDLGYDPDSRKAERTYNIIIEQSAKLRNLLGSEPYNELMYNVERL